jgi:hypothetical protein
VVRRRVIDEVQDGACISETGSLLAWLPLGRRVAEPAAWTSASGDDLKAGRAGRAELWADTGCLES